MVIRNGMDAAAGPTWSHGNSFLFLFSFSSLVLSLVLSLVGLFIWLVPNLRQWLRLARPLAAITSAPCPSRVQFQVKAREEGMKGKGATNPSIQKGRLIFLSPFYFCFLGRRRIGGQGRTFHTATPCSRVRETSRKLNGPALVAISATALRESFIAGPTLFLFLFLFPFPPSSFTSLIIIVIIVTPDSAF